MFKRITLLSFLFFCLGKTNAQSTLNVRAFVQGYYDSLSGTMIPVIDPVSQPTVFDTIRIELHESNSGNLALTLPAILDINGNTTVSIPPIYFGNNYYVALRHRNSLETWSALPLSITNNASYDFTIGITQAYGNSMILIDTVSCIFSGDVNQDGSIDSIDVNIVNDSSNVFAFGYYYSCDLNGDSAVDGNDAVILDNNINLYQAHSIIPVFTAVSSIANSKHEFFYPNPASKTVSLFCLRHYLNGTIKIYSISGDLIRTIEHFQSSDKIDINYLESGEYIIQLRDSEQINTQKLIVKN